MPDAKHVGISPALVETMAGLSAGSIATLTVHPLDIVKTRMQIHRSTTSPTKSLTTISLLRDMLATGHPIRALYRGLAPNLLGNASSWASFFFFKSRAELAITTFKSGSDAVPGKVLTPTDFFLSSLAAGAATQCITNPIWVLKTRIVSSDRNAAGAYPGMIAGVKHIIQTEGLRGFYRGLGVGLMGVSHGAVQFAVYEPAKRVYFRRKRDWTGDTGLQPDAKDAKITNDATVVLSTLSKFVAGTVTIHFRYCGHGCRITMPKKGLDAA